MVLIPTSHPTQACQCMPMGAWRCVPARRHNQKEIATANQGGLASAQNRKEHYAYLSEHPAKLVSDLLFSPPNGLS